MTAPNSTPRPDELRFMLNKGLATITPAEAPSHLAGDRSDRTDAPGSVPSPVLDAKALAKLRELDPTGTNRFVERILVTFQKSAARLEPQLAKARLDADVEAIRLVVHSFKSSSAIIGALALSEICVAIETEIVKKTGVDLNPGLDAVLSELAVALNAVAERLGAAS